MTENIIPPLLSGKQVAEMLGVSHQHVSQSAKRALQAQKENRPYGGNIPAPDQWIGGRPYWLKERIEKIAKDAD